MDVDIVIIYYYHQWESVFGRTVMLDIRLEHGMFDRKRRSVCKRDGRLAGIGLPVKRRVTSR